MNTSYIYSASRVNTLSQELLTHADIERLLVAVPGESLANALKETYLAPYLLQAADEDVAIAIEGTLVRARALIESIAPDSAQFRALWVQYDVHNLRVLAKGTKESLTVEQLAGYISKRGSYDVEMLAQYASEGTLNNLQPGWQDVYDTAVQHVAAGEIDKVDAEFDALVLRTMVEIAKVATDPFIAVYVSAVIDIHNCKAVLRASKLPETVAQPVLAAGGTVSPSQLVGVESVVSTLEYLSPGHFTTALEQFFDDGHTTTLDARCEEYIIGLAVAASIDMFSAASLVAYYLRVRQSATNIRTIVVGIESGQTTDIIRSNIRFAYVSN